MHSLSINTTVFSINSLIFLSSVVQFGHESVCPITHLSESVS